MLRLTSLSLLLSFSICIHAQSLVEARIAFVPHFNSNNSFFNGSLEFQSSINISPKPGTLGLESGILLNNSKTNFFSSRIIEPCINGQNLRPVIFTSSGPICDTTVAVSTYNSYTSLLRAGLFTRIKWNNQNFNKRLRIIPSLVFSAENQLNEIHFRRGQDEFVDGSFRSYGWFKNKASSQFMNFEFYMIAEIRIDYLIYPNWDLRLGLKADLSYNLATSEIKDQNGVLVALFLSKDLMSIK